MTSIIALGRAGQAPIDTPFTARAVGRDDPFAAQRLTAWAGDNQMSVGRVSWSGSITHTHFPHMELLIVQSGTLILETNAGVLRLAPGEPAVISRGAAVRLHAQTEASWIYCATNSSNAASDMAEAAVLAVNCAGVLTPSPPPAAEVLISAEPQCGSFPVFTDAASATRIGIWGSTPYTRKQVPHPVNEMMYILAGSVTLTDQSGRAKVFNQGDCAFVPHLTPCAWHSAVDVRKMYCVQDFPV